MNRKSACQILGVYPDISEKELKRTYRRLMNLTHPDSNADSDYPYDAYDINEAYGNILGFVTIDSGKYVWCAG